MTLDDVIDVLADAIAQRVLTKLGASSGSPLFYTTNKTGPHLPRKTRRWMLEHIKKIPGARQVGRDWEIAAGQYEAWAASEDAKRCNPRPRRQILPNELAQAANTNDQESADRLEAQRALRAAGFRRSR